MMACIHNPRQLAEEMKLPDSTVLPVLQRPPKRQVRPRNLQEELGNVLICIVHISRTLSEERELTRRSIDKRPRGWEFRTQICWPEDYRNSGSAQDHQGNLCPENWQISFWSRMIPNAAALTLRALGSTRIVNQIQVVSDGAGALEYVLRTGRYADRPSTAILM